MDPFVLLLISHVLGDGLITSSRLAELKRNNRLSYRIAAIAGHTGPHAVFAAALLLLVGGHWLKAAILVFSLHLFIDFTRCQLEMRVFGAGGLNFQETMAYFLGIRNDNRKPSKSKIRTWVLSNILDQGAHLVSLYGISLLV